MIKMYKNRLKELREERQLKQKDIANMLKIGETAYCQYEREYIIIPIKHLITLSEYFNVSLDYIFELTTTKQYAKINKEINKNICGQRIKEVRKEFSITQIKLANILNIGKGAIAGYEIGRYLIATPFLYILCKKYNISADYLLGKIDEPKYLK